MEPKYIVSATLGATGGMLAIWGFLNTNQGYINLGLAGAFLGAVILTLKSSKYVKKETAEILLESQKKLFNSILKNLKLEGRTLYIPPYENLPKGGVFLPLHEDFEVDPARFDEETLFITDVPQEKAMGLLLPSLGEALVEKYEEHLEGPLSSLPEVESAASSVLRALGLAKRVYIEETERGIRIIVDPSFTCNPEICEKLPCPICASILRAAAKASEEIIAVEKFEKKNYGIEIKAKKIGRVEEWM